MICYLQVPGFMVTQIRYIYEAGSKGRDSKAVSI